MRKKMFATAVMAAAVLLSGCGQLPDLDEISRNMEAEYMAGALLKYDKNNSDMLEYDRSILKATPTPVPTPQAVVTPSASGETEGSGKSDGKGQQTKSEDSVKQVSPGDALGLKQADIKLISMESKQTFGSADAAISAHTGKRLLVLRFRIKNKAGSAQRINLMKKQLTYTLEADGQTVGSPLMTILQNDLQFFNEKMASGRNSEAVLVFETDKKQKLNNVTVTVTGSDKTGQFQVQ